MRAPYRSLLHTLLGIYPFRRFFLLFVSMYNASESFLPVLQIFDKMYLPKIKFFKLIQKYKDYL